MTTLAVEIDGALVAELGRIATIEGLSLSVLVEHLIRAGLPGPPIPLRGPNHQHPLLSDRTVNLLKRIGLAPDDALMIPQATLAQMTGIGAATLAELWAAKHARPSLAV